MFLEDLKKITTVEEGLRFVFEQFDDLLISGKYEECDEIIENFNIEEFDISLTVGLLVISHPFENKLKNRENLYLRTEKIVNNNYSEGESKQILIGLK